LLSGFIRVPSFFFRGLVLRSFFIARDYIVQDILDSICSRISR
jgi:hypothetical protein